MSEAIPPPAAWPATIDGYLGRDPARWYGFAPVTLDALTALYGFSDGEGRSRRGEERIDYRFRALDRPDFTSPFMFHFAGDRLVFIETDFWSLDPATCARAIGMLGPAPERMDGIFRDSAIDAGEWLYPGRGLALCVMPETGVIARWTAFAPMHRADYCRTIRVTDRAQEFD